MQNYSYFKACFNQLTQVQEAIYRHKINGEDHLQMKQYRYLRDEYLNSVFDAALKLQLKPKETVTFIQNLQQYCELENNQLDSIMPLIRQFVPPDYYFLNAPADFHPHNNKQETYIKVANRNMYVGDQVFLIKWAEKSIIAQGEITAGSHFSPVEGSETYENKIKVRIDHWGKKLPIKQLESMDFERKTWRSHLSGVKIMPKDANLLTQLWAKTTL